MGAGKSDPASVFFMYPRMSASGQFVITASQILRKRMSAIGSLYGQLASNVLVTTFSNSVNSLKILQTGYLYVVDSKISTSLIMHPKSSATCGFVSCAESFSSSEYQTFLSTVLMPLQNNALGGQAQIVSDSFTKNGQTWRLAHRSVKFGTIDYTVLAVVPLEEVLAASSKVQTEIKYSIDVMTALYVIFMVIFICLLVLFSYAMVQNIVGPILQLKDILMLVTQGDLTRSLPSQSSSLDMHVLLNAFSNLMIALRYGSENYARGNNFKAQEVFNDALTLFTTSNNQKGIAGSCNNLAAVRMRMKNYVSAEELFMRSIKIGDELLTECKDDKDKERLQRVISDRKGNLALMYLESKRNTEAFAIIEQMLTQDTKNGYIRGMVVKQGTLGQYYMKQKEYKSSERVLKVIKHSLTHTNTHTNLNTISTHTHTNKIYLSLSSHSLSLSLTYKYFSLLCSL
jgi:hypothetical protein